MKTLFPAGKYDIPELEYQIHDNKDTYGVSIDSTLTRAGFIFSIDGLNGVSFDELFSSVKSTDKQLLLTIRDLLPATDLGYLQYIKEMLSKFPNLVVCNSNLEALNAIKRQFPDVQSAVNYYDKLYYNYQTNSYYHPKYNVNGQCYFMDFPVDIEVHNHFKDDLTAGRVNRGKRVIMDYPENTKERVGSPFNVLLKVRTTDDMEVVAKRELINTMASYSKSSKQSA